MLFRSLPWEKIFSLFKNQGDLLIEFPLPDDVRVQNLLKLKSEPQEYLQNYTSHIFESELKKYFNIDELIKLDTRNIYYCTNLNEK